MNALGEIISIMSTDDKSAFIKHLNNKNKRKDTLNTDLFKLLETDDINIKKKLYGTSKNTDAYHALRKRVYDSLISFMANRSFESNTDDEHEIMRLLMVSRVFFEHKLYKEAFKCLAKAESKALATEHFSLLNEIYQTQIQFAHFDPWFNLDKAIAGFSANNKKLRNEEQLNLAYAVMRWELGEIYHKGKITDLQQLITGTMKSFGISLREVLTFKSLYQMLFIANEYASINSNYSLIEPFLERSYRFIITRQELAQKHLYYHIYILYFMANIHFRNRRFTLCSQYLEIMAAEMQKQNKKYYSRFIARYYLLHLLNENYSGNGEATLAIMTKALAETKKADPTDRNDLIFFAVIYWLQHNNAREARRYMREFIHSDSWYEKRMGMDWAIKRSLVEIVMHTELEDTELALSRLKGFKRRYKKYLKEVNEERVLLYAALVEKYILDKSIAQNDTFKQQLDLLTQHAITESGDVFVLSFIGWLLATVHKKQVYPTILSLINNHFSPFHSA
ncbi:hypothetical protein [Flavobacterium beibuense]|uniref:hypothetical protein n=1 Tax=Flavobacterium beibuense TaxID=657326 RepID=UPI003A8E0482